MFYYQKENWNFLNMNSPADLHCNYKNDHEIFLEEYDRCRNGHCLLSSFFVDGFSMQFQTKIKHMEDGVALGLYFGDGCFSDYILAVVNPKGVEIRIPSKASNGDTFQSRGNKNYYIIEEQNITIKAPFVLGILKERNQFSVFINHVEVISVDEVKVGFVKKFARILLKATNESQFGPKVKTVFESYKVDGILEGITFKGICINKSTGKPLENLYVHLAGYRDFWAKTNKDGKFCIDSVPEGDNILIVGKEERQFTHINCVVRKESQIFEIEFPMTSERENYPQGEFETSNLWLGLNGIWKFEFDKDDIGEKEQWFKLGTHDFTRCIRVPYSWQSLSGFGEEVLADEYTLHQSNTFTSTPDEIGNIGWYQRDFQLSEDEEFNDLVIGAVSGLAKVWIDEKEIGCIVDSYNSYRFPLGQLKKNRKHTITIKVEYIFNNDSYCSGKQGFWFTDSPGVWQNIWIEHRKAALSLSDIFVDYYVVDDNEMNSVEIDIKSICEIEGRYPSYPINVEEKTNGEIAFRCECEEDGIYKLELDYCAEYGRVKVEAHVNEGSNVIYMDFEATCGYDYYDKKVVYVRLLQGNNTIRLRKNENFNKSSIFEIKKVHLYKVEMDYTVDILLDTQSVGKRKPILNVNTGEFEIRVDTVLNEPIFWTIENPFQYDLELIVSRDTIRYGKYKRKIGIRTIDAQEEIRLNHYPIFIRGVLDQGYNPWGLYTYRSIEKDLPGSMLNDILAAKSCGYNLIRMHIKDNEPDWYRLCDENGMLVWDEHPSNFYGKSDNPIWIGMYFRQLKAMSRKHNYHASIIIYSTFNESWGITGTHEQSPWDNMEGQRFIIDAGNEYKMSSSNILLVDNSGYGKTSITDIIDHHAYPEGYLDARGFFEKLNRMNYPGSCFNFYNTKNRQLMTDYSVRDLLQRNSSIDLENVDYIGSEYQSGQPVIVSEFIHTDGIEQMVRTFKNIKGYIRMNIASQENEDASPLTSVRTWRNYGMVHHDFKDATYKMINSKNLIYLDYPFLSKKSENEALEIPVYISLWDESIDISKIIASWKMVGVDYLGNYIETNIKGVIYPKVQMYTPQIVGYIKLTIPKGVKGAYLFTVLTTDEIVVCENYIQFEVFKDKRIRDDSTTIKILMEQSDRDIFMWNPSLVQYHKWNGYTGTYNNDGRHLYWAYGKGTVSYEVQINKKKFCKGVFIFEVSTCECLKGTRVTDEKEYEGELDVYMNDIFVQKICIKDHPSDRKGLFSNSSASHKDISEYINTGKYGYGYKIVVPMTNSVLEKIVNDGKVKIVLVSEKSGCIIYGNRMGMFGCDPYIILDTIQ